MDMTEKSRIVIVVSVPVGSEYGDRRKCVRIVDHFEQLGIKAEFERDGHGFIRRGDEGDYRIHAGDKACALAARAILAREYGLTTKIEGFD
jgi:hypothetical protein